MIRYIVCSVHVYPRALSTSIFVVVLCRATRVSVFEITLIFLLQLYMYKNVFFASNFYSSNMDPAKVAACRSWFEYTTLRRRRYKRLKRKIKEI